MTGGGDGRIWRRLIRFAGAIAVALVAAGAAQAQRVPVDLQLVLAVDASGSVNQYRFELQKQGYVAAFEDPRVYRAISSGPLGAIGITMFQWTGPTMQRRVVGWTLIDSQASALAFSQTIQSIPRLLHGGGTSISGAIDYAVDLLAVSPFESLRRVIDISGDGSNNGGRPVTFARDLAVGRGITINGLPILALEQGLDLYYQEHVIGGPSAFYVTAESFESFGDAILNKLIREIADLGTSSTDIPARRSFDEAGAGSAKAFGTLAQHPNEFAE
jgi:hypothetical protein